MKQRMTSSERRVYLLDALATLHATAMSQDDFTAVKVAQYAGGSTVLLYRLVREEFQALRAQLPGVRHSAETVERCLRQENADLRRQLRELKAQQRAMTIDALQASLVLQEQLEQENIELRSRVRLLTQRLDETRSYVSIPTQASRNTGERHHIQKPE